MADNRFNQMPGYPGGSQMGPQKGGLQQHFIQTTRPMNPMMQQQMMMPFAMQGMRMAPPNTPPPPYSAHVVNPSVVNLSLRPRTTLTKSKGPPKSEKERFYEEQRQKLKRFGKPGAAVVDADSLIGDMFKPDPKPVSKGSKAQHNAGSIPGEDDDDGFGDFLQGPSMEEKTLTSVNPIDLAPSPSLDLEPATLPVEEKKDLNSMMLECSDLSAPQKAKGFHKPSLNEVHRQNHDGTRRASFHESDHSRSWKHAEDLDGLFQIPVQAPVVPVQTSVAYTGHLAVSSGQIADHPVAPIVYPSATPMARPCGPPPAYSEALNHPSSPIMVMAPSPGFGSESQNSKCDAVPSTLGILPSNQTMLQNSHSNQIPAGPPTFSEWCSTDESKLPPLYKQVLDASLVDGQITTDRLYPILMLSGLPREKLAHIWSMCNSATPGQLIKTELWSILALIALAQNNVDTSRLDILMQCPIPPVPILVPQQNGSHPSIPTSFQNGLLGTPSVNPAPGPGQTASFVSSQTQPQLVHQPVPSPSLSLSSAAMSIASADDDFSDFQAALSPSNQQPQTSAGRVLETVLPLPDESYGEFIGGGNNIACLGGNVKESVFQLCASSFSNENINDTLIEQRPPSSAFQQPYSHHSNQTIQLHHHQHQHHNHFLNQRGGVIDCSCHENSGAQEARPAPPPPDASLSIPPLPVDDKYSTNVRSFFCSSDSSTGHTSPSFEDDDFTDGRDSLSQISTSEQSENDDIRNFESYVEEFNHKAKTGAGGSPLHCPFPSMHQTNSLPKHGKSDAQIFPAVPKPDQFAIMRQEMDLNTNSPISVLNQSTTSNHTSSSSPSISASVGDATDEFADFKSAHLTLPSAVCASVSTVSSISTRPASGHDDFADLKSDSPPSIHPQSQPHTEPSLMSERDKYGALRTLDDNDLMASSVFESSTPSGTGGEEEKGDDDEEWANFTEAPPAASTGMDGFSPATPAQPLETSTAPDYMHSQSQVSNTKDDILKLFASSKVTPMTSSITSEGSVSMVNSDSGYSSKSFFDATPTSGGQPELDVKDTSTIWSQSTSETTPGSESGDWADFGADQIKPRTVFTDTHFVEAKPTINISSHGAGMSAFTPYSSSHIAESREEPPPEKGPSGEEDDWGDFTQISASSTNGTELGVDNAVLANMVTIKKKNLGTSEIMGVFKVRNDPATLSTYQLPAKPSPPIGPSRVRKSSSSLNRKVSSDVDDDMVPPPMDSDGDDDDDVNYSRGYDLDDFMHRPTPITTYNPFGTTNTSPYFSRAGKSPKLKGQVSGSNEDSGSVHSLELPSSRPYENAQGDSHSISSSDLNSGLEPSAGGNGGVWKSMDSLDLPSDTVDTNEEDNCSETHSHGPIQPQELLASMPRLADKYNIDGEAQGNDRYRFEWERCLDSCCQILTEANTLFNNISSSSVCNEVLKASGGSEYVSCVIEIYRVGCRVMTAMSSTAISSAELKQTLKQMDLVWNNLSAFLVGASLLPDPGSLVFNDAVIKSGCENSSSQSLACGLCLLNVDHFSESSDSPSLSLSSSTIISSLSRRESLSKGINSKLTFAGRQYHSTCANFWVNCVNQTLPSLDLPELL